ncbi:MAG: hypothetical protein EA384_08475 [Spirochaetaceae bacterium]|nr:MAG: hypothetical protein EA384_08475 [Spirochaetaceae bacterium]
MGLLMVAILVLTGLALVLVRGKPRSAGGKRRHRRDRESVVRAATRALSQNPRDPEALRALADLYYDEQAWDKAFKSYAALLELSAANPELDAFFINLRHGLCALQLEQYDTAYKSLLFARSLNGDGFDLNYSLGYLEFLRRNFEKAISYLRAAREDKPEHIGTNRYLAQALYKIKKYNDAIGLLRVVTELQPEDTESRFVLARAYFELGQEEQAGRVFSDLRTDPDVGPRSALFCGTIRLKHKQYEQALTDFELGLSHQGIEPDVAIELRYRLAGACSRVQKIGAALALLEQVHEERPGYKDTAAQLERMRELHSNRNLQVFLGGGSSEFLGLCRKVVNGFFPQAQVKITDISMTRNEYADVLAEIETSTWLNLILFRFIRSSGQTGELMLRDFHARLKELKAGRGFCMTAGHFSDVARQFVEARVMDLVEKEQLVRILNKTS